MKKKLATIVLISAALLSTKTTTAQYLLTASQISTPSTLNNTQQICIGMSNVIQFDANNNQVFYVDSIKYINPQQTYIAIYFRDSTANHPGPYTTTNYNFCLPPKPVGTYNMSIHQQDNSTAYPLPNFTLTVVCNGTPSNSTINLNNCDSVTYNTQTYYSSINLIDTFQSVNSCDSIVTANIVIGNTTPTIILTDTICANDNYLLPNNFNLINLQSDTTLSLNYTNQNGCDSNYSINIKVDNALDTTITQVGNALFSNQSNANFKWYDCNSQQIISGQTNQFYAPTQSGNFACIITKGACLDTTVCYNYLATAINDYTFRNKFAIYPNPNNGNFILNAEKLKSIMILNSIGQQIYELRNPELYNNVRLESSPPGIYFVELKFKNGSSSIEKLIIK